jgi:polyhydroxyalkanoate synthesis regulator protein
MKMFSPFGFAAAARPEAAAAAPAPEAKGGDDAIDDLKKQMAAMQEQIERLAKK